MVAAILEIPNSISTNCLAPPAFCRVVPIQLKNTSLSFQASSVSFNMLKESITMSETFECEFPSRTGLRPIEITV